MIQNSDNTSDTRQPVLPTPEISIIVPVYNVEIYLRECLESIERQTFTDWECIVVDDGSPDGSDRICDEFAARDSRFIVIHKINGGLSSARNAGLKRAQGKYISFIDSDDSVKPEFLQHMWQLITTTGADVVQVEFERQFTTYSRPHHALKELKTLNRRELLKELLIDNKVPNYVWMKMFRREVIDTPFPEGETFEDIYVMNHWARNIHKMVLSPQPLYQYRQRRGSIVNSNYSKYRLDFLKAKLDRQAKFHQIDSTAVSQQTATKILWKNLVNAAKPIARYTRSQRKRRQAIDEISGIARKYELPAVRTLGLKRWLRAYLLRNRPHLFIHYVRFFYNFNYNTRHNHSHLFE